MDWVHIGNFLDNVVSVVQMTAGIVLLGVFLLIWDQSQNASQPSSPPAVVTFAVTTGLACAMALGFGAAALGLDARALGAVPDIQFERTGSTSLSSTEVSRLCRKLQQFHPAYQS
jgi:hypothetical protein